MLFTGMALFGSATPLRGAQSFLAVHRRRPARVYNVVWQGQKSWNICRHPRQNGHQVIIISKAFR